MNTPEKPTTDDRITALEITAHRQAGAITALKIVCIALIETHPQKTQALKTLADLSERGRVSDLYSPANDEAMQACERLLSVLLRAS